MDGDLREDDLLRALRAGGFHGDGLRDVRIASRTGSDASRGWQLDGLQPDVISGQDLRVALGARSAGSTSRARCSNCGVSGDTYRLPATGPDTASDVCDRIGAAGRAGQSADAILARYSGPRDPGRRRAGATLRGRTAASAGRVSLPDDDEGERAAIGATGLRARDELARALGVAAPPR